MLVCASIIAQPNEPQGNKSFLSRIMHGNYAGFARSVVAIVDFFGGHCSVRHFGFLDQDIAQV
jgi:hypothetical protein